MARHTDGWLAPPSGRSPRRRTAKPNLQGARLRLLPMVEWMPDHLIVSVSNPSQLFFFRSKCVYMQLQEFHCFRIQKSDVSEALFRLEMKIKFFGCHIGYIGRKKNKLHSSSGNCKTNLLSIINLSLAHVGYCST